MNHPINTSLIIPSYNSTRFLPQLVAAIELMAPQPDQVIFVDDCSNDGSADLFESLISKSRVSGHVDVIRRSLNGGTSSARNDGLDIATGRVVAFCDSDDLPLPWRMAIHLQDLDSGERDGVSYGAIAGFRDGDSKCFYLRGGRRYRRGQVTKTLIRRNFVPFSTVAVSGTAREARFEVARYNEDWLYLINQSLLFSFHTQARPLAMYRYSAAQKSHENKRPVVVSALEDLSIQLHRRSNESLARVASRQARMISRYKRFAELPVLYREVVDYVPSRVRPARQVNAFLAQVVTRAGELAG